MYPRIIVRKVAVLILETLYPAFELVFAVAFHPRIQAARLVVDVSSRVVGVHYLVAYHEAYASELRVIWPAHIEKWRLQQGGQ